MESRLVPEAGFDIQFVRSAGLNRVGLAKQIRSLIQLPLGIVAAADACSANFAPKQSSVPVAMPPAR